MSHSLPMKRAGLLARSAIGLLLALGAVSGASVALATAANAKAPKISLSKGFQPAAVEAQKAVDAAKKGGDVADARAKVDAAFAAIANEDDRFMAGNLAVGLGGAASDPALQRRGIEAMLQSGKLPQEELGKFNFYAGQLAFQGKDYAAAQAALQRSIELGYREGDPEVLLAETMLANNQAAQGLGILKQAIEAKKASGALAPVSWYRRGLGASYTGKQFGFASQFSAMLARDYPSKENWGGAITVVREVGSFPAQETLDLMRLMDRTGSYAEERDYIEYIQAADARRLPGEVMKVIAAGKAAGKLNTSDTFIAEATQIAQARLAEDRASLTGLERDARAPGASAATLMGAADAFLSYDEPGKAADLYALALTRPGADMPRLLTRLGIAQVGIGKYSEAVATFGKVTGPRKPIAELWAIYAGHKLAPAPAAAPVSPAAPQ